MRIRSKSAGRALCLVIASGVFIDTSRAASWSEINTGLSSAAVNVSSIVIVPAQPSTLYARTIGADGIGGIFKTTDGAGTWKAISNVVGVNSLVVDPQSPSTVYAVTGRGLLKSTDGGQSWIDAGSGLPAYIAILAIDPNSSSKLYAVSATGIFKSTDGAGSWNALNTGLPTNTYIGSFVIDATNTSRIYATTSLPQNNGPPKAVLLRSTDGGESWSAIDPGLAPNSSISFLTISSTAPSVIYAIANSQGPAACPRVSILKSADGGDNWTDIDTGLPPGADVSSLIIDPKSSSTHLSCR